jgi:hypothetical protein
LIAHHIHRGDAGRRSRANAEIWQILAMVCGKLNDETNEVRSIALLPLPFF